MKKIGVLTLTSLLLISSNTFAKEIKPFKVVHNGMHHEKGVKSGATKEIKLDNITVKFYLTNLNEVNKTIKSFGKKSIYACSMHPFAISDKKEACPICNMAYSKTESKNFELSKGNYHFDVVVTDNKTDELLNEAKIKVKIISPDKKEEEKMLENEMGYFESTFNLKKSGKYGIIALIQQGNKDKIAKFYYENK